MFSPGSQCESKYSSLEQDVGLPGVLRQVQAVGCCALHRCTCEAKDFLRELDDDVPAEKDLSIWQVPYFNIAMKLRAKIATLIGTVHKYTFSPVGLDFLYMFVTFLLKQERVKMAV